MKFWLNSNIRLYFWTSELNERSFGTVEFDALCASIVHDSIILSESTKTHHIWPRNVLQKFKRYARRSLFFFCRSQSKLESKRKEKKSLFRLRLFVARVGYNGRTADDHSKMSHYPLQTYVFDASRLWSGQTLPSIFFGSRRKSVRLHCKCEMANYIHLLLLDHFLRHPLEERIFLLVLLLFLGKDNR